jgi:hypothetical protein
MNQCRGRGVFSASKPTLFRHPVGDETKLWRDETIFGLGEDSRKLALVTKFTTKRRAAKAQ